MIQKIKNLHDELESASEQLGDLQTQGVVDGWDEMLRCTNTPQAPLMTPKYAKQPCMHG